MTREDFLRAEVEKLRGKIKRYQETISEWEAELGGTPATHPEPEPNSAKHKDHPRAGDPNELVREYMFFNKSQPEAAKALLELVGHPLRTAIIVECIEKGGVKIGGATAKDKKQNLYTILSRSGQFGRAAKDTWGLPNWPGVTAVEIKSGKENGTEETEETKPDESKKTTAGESKPL